ncbi:hypothetical protein [Urbifossiella limnaea]|uniref:Uncharacterized protein n=1 Tax=Urbifossiella limnaea TaxID=2528023 RepID=A0A517XW45_9BACT|nr:hypothetical protein [Urbifossiella limnaea]QDU21729.1 hypothetical protein ETAA1_37020 [Urbifossiella limnaea]
MTATTNGRPRKQLSEQLDRMDSIVDALAEALPEAVTDAVREGARQAVREVLAEVLTNPDLRALISGVTAARVAPPPPTAPDEYAPAAPGIWTRTKAKLAAVRAAAAERFHVAAAKVAVATRTVAALMPVRKILAVGAGVGVAVGVASYLCPHGLSAVVGGVGGMCTAVGVQVGTWFRRSARSLGFGGTG